MILYHVPAVNLARHATVGLAIWADDAETAEAAACDILGGLYKVGTARVAPEAYP